MSSAYYRTAGKEWEMEVKHDNSWLRRCLTLKPYLNISKTERAIKVNLSVCEKKSDNFCVSWGTESLEFLPPSFGDGKRGKS